MRPFFVAFFLILSASSLCAGDVAMVVGIGAVRRPAAVAPAEVEAPPEWDRWFRPDARLFAESAFRELVEATRREPYLYDRSPRWFDPRAEGFSPAVLLTDGVADNSYIPLAPLIISETRQLGANLSIDDDYLLFIAAMGQADGWDTDLLDRLNQPIALETLADAIPAPEGGGRRLLLARVYEPDSSAPPRTLLAADGETLHDIRRWVDEAVKKVAEGKTVEHPGRIFSGLPPRRDAFTPIRLRRMQKRLAAPPVARNGLKLADLGDSMESAEQTIELQVGLTEEKVFKKIRKPGPLFTIIEVDSDELIRIDRTIERERMILNFKKEGVAEPTLKRLLVTVEGESAESFNKAVLVNGVSYQLTFDKSADRLTVAYLD